MNDQMPRREDLSDEELDAKLPWFMLPWWWASKLWLIGIKLDEPDGKPNPNWQHWRFRSYCWVMNKTTGWLWDEEE